jgi:L-arabinose transport system ATP-binding protein
VSAPLLKFENIGKSFPGVVALNDVSFSVEGGEIRALMGENGAGKSTLLKVLSGEFAPDSGAVEIGGLRAAFGGPRAAMNSGIAIIHQELQLAPEMSVEENLLLGGFPSRGPFVDGAATRRMARAILERLGEDIDPRARVKTLPIGRRQMIEIGKALLRKARIIAFDEPTSSLSARETETLMRIIRDLKRQGCAVIYVSHRIEEIFELCDSVTILRDGRLVATHPDMTAITRETLIAQMAGREIKDIYSYRPRALGEKSIEVEGLVGLGLSAPVSFSARKGEILGFFGLVGAGRTELFKLLYGAHKPRAGALRIHGKETRPNSPRAAIERGLALCPEDRKDEGVAPLASVRDNLVMAHRNIRGVGLWRNFRREREQAREAIQSLNVKTVSDRTAIGTLSGGNQQKVVVARWLIAGSDILLMDEPTRGIDVGARSEIYALLYRLAEEGKTLLVSSSDMPEALGLCDRIIIMREGRIAGELERAKASQEAVLSLALPDAGALAGRRPAGAN